jgi:hypothetical protein
VGVNSRFKLAFSIDCNFEVGGQSVRIVRVVPKTFQDQDCVARQRLGSERQNYDLACPGEKSGIGLLQGLPRAANFLSNAMVQPSSHLYYRHLKSSETPFVIAAQAASGTAVINADSFPPPSLSRERTSGEVADALGAAARRQHTSVSSLSTSFERLDRALPALNKIAWRRVSSSCRAVRAG